MARYLGYLSDKMSDLQSTWDGHLVRLSAYKIVPKLFEMTILMKVVYQWKPKQIKNEPKTKGNYPLILLFSDSNDIL
jgi:hypothetical protein